MQYGFSYNGVHCNDMHCTYVPTAKKRWVLPSYDTISSDVTERDGGYYYRTRQNVRTFSLDCFFENITEHQLRKIARWLDRKTAGELIFDARPDVVYRVRPSKQIEPEIYEHLLEGNEDRTYSGTFTATFTAYEPFGSLTKKSYGTGDDAEHYTAYCGMIRDSEMPPSPTADSRTFLLYNCGTEPCGAYFSLKGSAPNGFTITNETNGSRCKVLALPGSPALLIIDSDNCKVLTQSGSSLIRSFELHDDGYILLSPYEEVYRDVTVTWAANSNIVYIDSNAVIPSDDLINKFIYLGGNWQKIADCLDDGGLVVMNRFSTAGSQSSMITTMNEIVIEGDDLSLEDISVVYTPKVL